MSESHDICFGSLAILMGKHQDLGLDDRQLLMLLSIESSLPEVLGEAIKNQVAVESVDFKRLVNMKVRPSLEAADEELGANGVIIEKILAFLEKILPLILPLFVNEKK